MRFAEINNDGQEAYAVTCLHLWAGVYGLVIHNETKASIQSAAWNALFQKAIAHAKAEKATQILYRLIEAEESKVIGEFLPDLGFRKKQDRIEFRSPLEQLPSSEGTPLLWKNALTLQWPIERIGAFLKEVAEGDPDSDPTDDPVTYMQDWLNDPVLKSGLDCIEVGFIDNEPATFVVAQVNPKSGWSRISYMGVVPKFRGRDLGKWVHRRGFEMMRTQCGKLYHGGTVVTNRAMLRLFRLHACSEYQRMQEWILNLEIEQ